MEFKYYYGSEAEQFSFIRIPKVMLTEERFSSLSLASKILYGVLLDRMSLSVKNGWLDEEQRVFIIFKIEEIQEILGFSKKKSIEYLGELETFGLVEKKRRGLGLPSILYIKSFMSESGENGTSRGVEIDTSVSEDIASQTAKKQPEPTIVGQGTQEKGTNCTSNTSKTSEIEVIYGRNTQNSCVRSVDLGTSGGVEIALQEVSDSTSLKNNTYNNNTYQSNTVSNPIISGDAEMGLDEMGAYAELIKDNIEYSCLMERYTLDHELLEGIFDLILETVLCKSDKITIASSEYPTELVRSKFLKLNCFHIEYVLECLKGNTTKVRNIKKYLLATLFNAPSTISGYFLAEVNHDMQQFVVGRRGECW